MKLKILFLSLLCASNLFSQKIKFIIKDKLTQKPIEKVSIKIDDKVYQSNQAGEAEAEPLPIKYYSIQISSVAYSSIILHQIRPLTNKTLNLAIEMEPKTTKLEAIEVRTANSPRNANFTSVKSIELDEVLRLPATFLDPARLAMSYAGVANNNDQANGISIRGNAPELVQWRLEGAEIVNPNHLSNAGTFSDQPTAAGGGTTILSAQLMGNMSLHTGAFGASYGNVVGGILDMGFRNGNLEKHAKTIQVGLIGVDLSAEGPLSKDQSSSYLINYRYSFTGLLGLMGVRFGGEDIRFQDLSLNLFKRTKKLGEFNVFMMGGKSSNDFEPPVDSILTEKDKYNITFNSFMISAGLKHSYQFKSGWTWRFVLVESGLQNLRSAYIKDPFLIQDYRFNAKNILSINANVSGKVLEHELKAGLAVNHYFDEANQFNRDDDFYSFDRFIVQPHLTISNNKNKFKYNIGLQTPYYEQGQQFYIEPRLGLSYILSKNLKMGMSYGLHSQQIFRPGPFISPALPLRSHHVNTQLQYKISNKQLVTIEGFYQRLFQVPVVNNLYISILNGFPEYLYEENYTGDHNQGQNFGLELGYQYFLNKGFYLQANATYQRNYFRAFDNKFYEGKYDFGFLSNVSLGKEFTTKKDKIWGINARFNYMGSQNAYQFDRQVSFIEKRTVYAYNKPPEDALFPYKRLDLRIYRRAHIGKKTSTWSLDIQNAMNTQNPAYYYFDAVQTAQILKYQLGLLPLLNYRVEF